MKNLIKILTVLLIVGCMAEQVFAGDETRVGTAGATELLIPVGSRGIALGGSVIASASGLEALYWNPAGLSYGSASSEVMFSNMSYIANISVNNFAASVKFGTLGTLAASVKSLSFGSIPVTTIDDPDGLLGKTYSPTYLTVGLTFSKAFSDKIYFGVTGKLITEKIQGTSASGVAFDLGLQYITPVGIRLGVVVKNLGSTMQFDGPELETITSIAGKVAGSANQPLKIQTATFELPSSLELGISYMRAIAENNFVTVSGNFVNNNFRGNEYRGGLEYSYKNIFFIRGGYNAAESNADNYTFNGAAFGAGFNYTVGKINFTFDFAYQSAKIFDGNKVFTVKLGF